MLTPAESSPPFHFVPAFTHQHLPEAKRPSARLALAQQLVHSFALRDFSSHSPSFHPSAKPSRISVHAWHPARNAAPTTRRTNDELTRGQSNRLVAARALARDFRRNERLLRELDETHLLIPGGGGISSRAVARGTVATRSARNP